MDGGGPRIGVAIGAIGATPRWWLESAVRLDAAGYQSVWCWDHFVGRGDRTVPDVEQWTMLSAVAGATERIGLGTFVTNVMNRHPALLARMAGTVQ
ncbi:MAG: LLM class flavin-dependent oxidoreductase, partial [Chloroflexi bacterium]|nr:LLM class flavin-dependent oxidoreductase [Chloroflexota bacterium]